MTDSIAFELAVTKARISKGAIADALGISRMSLTRKINNVTEFKASEISLLKTILRLDDQERDKIFLQIMLIKNHHNRRRGAGGREVMK